MLHNMIARKRGSTQKFFLRDYIKIFFSVIFSGASDSVAACGHSSWRGVGAL